MEELANEMPLWRFSVSCDNKLKIEQFGLRKTEKLQVIKKIQVIVI